MQIKYQYAAQSERPSILHKYVYNMYIYVCVCVCVRVYILQGVFEGRKINKCLQQVCGNFFIHLK